MFQTVESLIRHPLVINWSIVAVRGQILQPEPRGINYECVKSTRNVSDYLHADTVTYSRLPIRMRRPINGPIFIKTEYLLLFYSQNGPKRLWKATAFLDVYGRFCEAGEGFTEL